MLVLPDGDGALVIGQAAHAWVSGQLARAWGNERFPAPSPRDPVCLAAGQHDAGWAAWDAEPEVDPATGRPYAFTAMPLATHLELLATGPRLLLTQSRHAALLASLHASALYGRRRGEGQPPERAAAIRAFLDDHRRFQDELRATLGPEADEDWVHRHQRLLWTWDGLSLALLLGWAPFEAADVPSAKDPTTLALRETSPGRFTLDPWPFASGRVVVRCEGRRLAAPSRDTAELRAALASAPWVTIECELAPPG